LWRLPLLSVSKAQMTSAEKFGHRLRTIRKSRKLKIGELAEKADTGVKHLGRIERGEKQPSFELIASLAQALSVSPARLFEFEPPPIDSRALRNQLSQVLADLDVVQLRNVYRIVKALVEP